MNNADKLTTKEKAERFKTILELKIMDLKKSRIFDESLA